MCVCLPLIPYAAAAAADDDDDVAGPALALCCCWSPPRICNREIISRVQQVICFAFHDSRLLLETCRESKEAKKITTLFYLD
jgi:hypothetical protein